MELTQEQQAIINSTGNIKINAIAGSGKTTTIIEYAKARPGTSKILYLAFNKSVKLEAIKKFAAKGLNNVTVETAHSLAYKRIVFKYNYKVRPHGYKIHEIAELLGLKSSGEKHTEYIIANHINSYTYADEGASLYDVLNLYNHKRGLIRDKLIKKMANLDELEDYIEKTEDAQLAMMVEIVKEYGNEIPGLIKDIKKTHIDNDDKENAELVFSTVHRCKGMEYDSIQIVNDFISEEKLEKHIAETSN